MLHTASTSSAPPTMVPCATTMEKRTINWKDPNVYKILIDFIEGRLPFLRNITDFANHINNICNTNITLSTIRNRVYQEQRERRLLFQGMQAAAAAATQPGPSGATVTAQVISKGPLLDTSLLSAPPEPAVSLVQAVPVMVRQEDGEFMQGFAIVSDANNILMLPENGHASNASSAPTATLTTAVTSTSMMPVATNGHLEATSSRPSTSSPASTVTSASLKRSASATTTPTQTSRQPPKIAKVQPQPPPPPIDYPLELVDEPLDDLPPDYVDYDLPCSSSDVSGAGSGPPPPEALKLPNEFRQHFDAKRFRVDMGSLRELSVYVREKVDYLAQATDVYPHHNSFVRSNIDAFERNLDVIKQAGDYFELMLAFESDPNFFPEALSELGTAIGICAANGTAKVDQFRKPCADTEALPGSRLTKNGMNNLITLLNGILTEAESLFDDYDHLRRKGKGKVNKVKIMMLTLQFSRFYHLCGKFAKCAMKSHVSKEGEQLAEKLNRMNFIKLNPEDTELEDVIELSDSPVMADHSDDDFWRVHKSP